LHFFISPECPHYPKTLEMIAFAIIRMRTALSAARLRGEGIDTLHAQAEQAFLLSREEYKKSTANIYARRILQAPSEEYQ
jgi:hypothetical protein